MVPDVVLHRQAQGAVASLGVRELADTGPAVHRSTCMTKALRHVVGPAK